MAEIEEGAQIMQLYAISIENDVFEDVKLSFP